MSAQDDEALAPLYALGALDGEDLARFTAELAESEPLRILVRDYQEAAAVLPHSLDPVSPSPELKARILAAATGQAAPRSAIATRLFWAVAALILFAVLIGTLTQPAYETVALTGADPIPGARGTIRWNERSLRFHADGLALLPDGKIYALWQLPPGKAPIPAGTYLPDPYGSVRGEFTLQDPVARGDGFGVSIERGAQKAPAGPMILTTAVPK